jgi:hypothetical protein
MRIATPSKMLPYSPTTRRACPGIDDFYKRRWRFELFFRLFKQSLDFKHFLGEAFLGMKPRTTSSADRDWIYGSVVTIAHHGHPR